MSYEHLNGRRYIGLVRCSTDEQADTSIPDQLRLLEAFAQQHGMVHAGEDVILDGVSGSKPGARTDIDEVIRRKQAGEDFDVLLVQDTSRLTRGGAEHGAKLEYDLLAAGIDIVYAASPLPDGEHAGIIKSVEFYSAQQYAKAVSFGVARGQMSAIVENRMSYCLRPPYAIDRLYVGMDGRPLHIIRNLPSGTQQKLDPKTGQVLQTWPRPQKGQRPLRYRKQAGERIVLVPGADEQVEAVRRMFRRKLIDGWGPWRIAKELNDAGIASPNGRLWTTTAVKLLLRNPIYTGVGFANRRTHALYHTRSDRAPAPATLKRQERMVRKSPPVRHRPRKQWVEQEQPELAGFLVPQLRALAVEYQKPFLTGMPRGTRTTASDKHVDSSFILKGILSSKQGGFPMTGRTQGTAARPYRYYRITKAAHIPTGDDLMRRTIRADAIEPAVLAAVREVLLQADHLRPMVAQAIHAELERTRQDGDGLGELLKQREVIREQISFILDDLGTLGREAAKEKARQLEAKLAALEERIVKAGAVAAGATVDVEAAVGKVISRLTEMGQSMDTLPPQALRALLGTLIGRLEVDLETKAVELELALPAWAAFDEQRYKAALGLGGRPLQRAIPETHGGFSVRMVVFECMQAERGCYDCRRKAA